MPGRDGTGPMGYGPMTGGRRGWCGSEPASVGQGMGAGRSAGMGRGGGWRNQYRATGLTGWERAAQADARAAAPVGEAPDPFARLEETLAQVLERLERLEAAGQR